jgi:hypothetical protein
MTGTTIVNVTEQEDMPTVEGQWAEVIGPFGPGDSYILGVFTRNFPNIAIPAREFWRRFTVTEREALQNLMTTGTQAQKNKLNAFQSYVRTGMDVELFDDYIIASVNLLETSGIIAPGRAAVILAR